jgi:hypothetical protein
MVLTYIIPPLISDKFAGTMHVCLTPQTYTKCKVTAKKSNDSKLIDLFTFVNSSIYLKMHVAQSSFFLISL